jgi:hypothetical protein
MNTEQGFTLHPGAAQDITDIWEFIVEDNPLAARRVREDILDAVRSWCRFRTKDTRDLTSPQSPCGSKPYVTTSSPTHQTKSRLWCSPCCMVAAVLA